jgi:hypothetical protein
MVDNQYIDAFTAAGGWFIAKYFEMIDDFLEFNN